MPDTNYVYVINIHDKKTMSYLGTIQKVFKKEKDAFFYKDINCCNDFFMYVVTKVDLL